MSIPLKWWPTLREQVRMMQLATENGTRWFEAHAKQTGAEIRTCRYNELKGIWCDTLAWVEIDGENKLVCTEQNLQYFPEKIRYYVVR